MQRIPLIKSRSGMVLAQAVRRPDGLVLVGEGQALTDALISRIRASGVATVWVEGNPLGTEETVGNLRNIVETLPHLFRRQENNVFMMTLCSVFSRHFSRKMAEQQALENAAIERGKNGETRDAEDPAGAGDGK